MRGNSEFQQLLLRVQQDPASFPQFQHHKGLLFFKGKLYLPSVSTFKSIFLEEFHSSTIGGHSGIEKTYGRLKENVYWEGMKADVAKFVQTCLVCQQTKIPTQLPYGLLQPLPIPTAVWEDISLDFIIGLPSFQNHTVILVVVDRFSKAAHFGMLPTNFTACKVAELFAHLIFKHHGMPKSMVSDRYPIFLSRFWQQLFKNCGTQLRMSSAYHPQSDGQTEIVNKALQQYLRCFVHNEPHKWGKYLHLAEWHYNTSVHSSTGFTPFQVVFGKPPPTLAQYVEGFTNLEAVHNELLDRDRILELLRKKLEKAQAAMKHFADHRRIHHPFKVGDQVLVKLRPYRQTSVGGHNNKKLGNRYFGPFKILRQMGDVAFELQLPDASRIHPVFHVSKLKPFHGNDTIALPLPAASFGNQPVIHPMAVLDWKQEPDSPVQVLVQWSNTFPEDASWEILPELQKAYPNFHLEDKVFVEGEKDVMNEDTDVEEPHPGRPKRTPTLPKWLQDFNMPHKLK
jgi:hypothetical protein